eukprot:NODE_4149_length_1930_cov_4.363283.p1 GENE.NODE_4149_length_1930_cov_4.363283~~NODE_4149_length_1930_cov_4.363283.p1  ORF type:complete len:385 (+),score=61.17 NODE_4149_length_1930_cov_4.363283:138-1292(+)
MSQGEDIDVEPAPHFFFVGRAAAAAAAAAAPSGESELPALLQMTPASEGAMSYEGYTLLGSILSTCTCPITKQIMEHPVICADGFTYERADILKWFALGKRNSPMTNHRLKHIQTTPNNGIKAAIQELQQNRDRYPELAELSRVVSAPAQVAPVYSRWHCRKRFNKIRVTERLKGLPLIRVGERFGVSGSDWLIVSIDRDPDERLYWPDEVQVMIRSEKDRHMVLNSFKQGPPSHRIVTPSVDQNGVIVPVRLENGLIIPDGYGCSVAELTAVGLGEMITLRQDRFDWLPGANTVLQKGQDIVFLQRDLVDKDIEIISVEEAKRIEALLQENEQGYTVLTKDYDVDNGGYENVILYEGYEFRGQPTARSRRTWRFGGGTQPLKG